MYSCKTRATKGPQLKIGTTDRTPRETLESLMGTIPTHQPMTRMKLMGARGESDSQRNLAAVLNLVALGVAAVSLRNRRQRTGVNSSTIDRWVWCP